tara:strand:+ start:56 stop:835 length:780 start_codon:yes stop_codon:yes gene_type:complete
MKAIILAAGMGTRMKHHTSNMPKGMVKILDRTLIARQISILRDQKIDKISIVTGYKSEKINYPNINFYHNENYENTNMVESLMCAKNEFDDDIIISYADLIFSKSLVSRLIKSEIEIGVCVDPEWQNYWKYRYGNIDTDIESLSVNNNKITELGKPINSSLGLKYRYIGVNKFSINSLNTLLDFYENKKIKLQNWSNSGNDFFNGYMTDLLNELIGFGSVLTPVMCPKEWLEIDTDLDYQKIKNDIKTGTIKKYFSDTL